MQGVGLLFGIILGMGARFYKGLDFTTTLGKLWICSFFFLIVIGLIALLLLSYSYELGYKKDGELLLTENSVSIDNTDFKLADITKIDFVVQGVQNEKWPYRKMVDPANNRIVIYKNNNEELKKSFVLSTREEYNSLKDLLMQWKQRGIKVKVYGFDLLLKNNANS